jgi:hypothetical protein
MPKDIAAETVAMSVMVVGTQAPAAVVSKDLHSAPLNLTADGMPVVAFRDPRTDLARAFTRRVDDLSPRFKPMRDSARLAKGAFLVDLDTDSGWSADGVAVDAKKEFRNKKLSPVVAEEGLYWGVMKHWYPKLELAQVEAPPAPVKTVAAPATAPAPESGTGRARARRAQEPARGTRGRSVTARRSAGR